MIARADDVDPEVGEDHGGETDDGDNGEPSRGPVKGDAGVEVNIFLTLIDVVGFFKFGIYAGGAGRE
jgi:hypothetical protein